MKKSLLLLLLVISLSEIKAQSTPSDGHYLTWVQDNIKVYQSTSGQAVTTAYKYWNFKFWFYADEESISTVNNVDYIKIYIPNGDENNITIQEESTAWSPNFVSYVTTADYNKWLFLKKADYDKLKNDHYPKRTYGLVLSALTVPFKIHPTTGTHASSLYNSNWNAGTFAGIRLGFLNDYLGLSIGGTLGISSLNQTASENTAITDNSSTTMSAVNYGGGFVIDLGKKIQLGAIMGWDHGYGDKSSTYIYQDKSWFALSLNFNFLDFSKKDNTQN